jgi:hypothetical protein
VRLGDLELVEKIELHSAVGLLPQRAPRATEGDQPPHASSRPFTKVISSLMVTR